MARGPSAVKCPVARWVRGIERDAGMDAELQRHLLSIGRQTLRLVEGTSVLFRFPVETLLGLRRKRLERDPDCATLAKLLGQEIVALRSLGLLRAVGSGAGPVRRGKAALRDFPASGPDEGGPLLPADEEADGDGAA